MSEYDSSSLLYSDRDISVSIDTSEFSSQESIFYSEIESSSCEEVSEENREEESERSSEISESTLVSDDSVILTKIYSSLNNIYGLLIVSLVLIGCGLILKYIWGLLNK